MSLGFGLLSAQLKPGETDWTRAYQEVIDLAVEAERRGFSSVMLPGESLEAAEEGYRRHLWHMSWKYDDMEASATRPLPPPPAPDADEGALRGRSVLAGRPEEIVSTLLEIRERADVPVEFAARSFLPTLEYTAQVELMQRLAEEVAPHL